MEYLAPTTFLDYAMEEAFCIAAEASRENDDEARVDETFACQCYNRWHDLVTTEGWVR
jgi:hypothetical protein